MGEKKRLYLTRAVHHYNKLFTLPKYWVILFLLLLTSLGGSSVAFAIARPDFRGVLDGVRFAFQVLFFPMIVVDIISRETFTKANAIFDLKRSASLSLVICLAWVIIMVVGSTLQSIFQISRSLYYSTFFSICITIAMRFLVTSTVTQMSYSKLVLVTFTLPLVMLISNMIFWNAWSPQLAIAVMISSAILVIATQLLIFIVNRQGEVVTGIGSIYLFKGFISNWLEDFTYPLEGHFEKVGTVTDVSVNLFVFRSKKRLKAILVIPSIHPGPFRNLGSSNLPSMIQRSLEKKFMALTAVPHGLSGHELDLTSQSQCRKVIREILRIQPSNFSFKASKTTRIDSGLAKASCQFFGDTALLTVTCAPKSMEDIPLDVGAQIMQICKKLGVNEVAIIDAHNSIGSTDEAPIFSEENAKELVFAAEKALKGALKEERHPFFVGVAKTVPSVFSTAQGMGPGGIVALVVVVAGQKTLYITIDGNNMISGLREKIIQEFSDNFDECEVFTTDTHIVNGISTIKRGYNPVGEAVDHEQLISFIKDVVAKAAENTEEVEASFIKVEVKNVKVIGEEKLVNLSMLVDLTFSLIKRVAPLIYTPAFIGAILPFIILR